MALGFYDMELRTDRPKKRSLDFRGLYTMKFKNAVMTVVSIVRRLSNLIYALHATKSTTVLEISRLE
jgi:hypothetical protein